jgi:phosphinothricin acetyltransferase
MSHVDTIANEDLRRVLRDIEADRNSLLRVLARLTREDLGYARRGGWTIKRVLQHVIESEQMYAKLLAHQCGKTAQDLKASPPEDGHEASARLAETRAGVLAMIDGIDDDTLYRLVRIGHEEYSPLSVLENIALHDREHRAQIAELLSSHRQAQRDANPELSNHGLTIRYAGATDLARITEIYNHYVEKSAATFDLVPFTVEQRMEWFEHYSSSGPHRLLVAESARSEVLGYASSSQFRAKPAYDTTIETTIYCAPEATGRGIGVALYTALFDAVRDEDIHVAVAGITLPNDPSVALHARFGFERIGLMPEVGRKFGRYWDVAWFMRELR